MQCEYPISILAFVGELVDQTCNTLNENLGLVKNWIGNVFAWSDMQRSGSAFRARPMFEERDRCRLREIARFALGQNGADFGEPGDTVISYWYRSRIIGLIE
jgi:hypothetical protein